MGSSRREIELEEQLKEVGNVLLSPPSAINELTTLLDKVEHLLANVEQAPPRSMQDALLPSMKALIVDELLRHSDMDVRLSVLSCISEITRITAPEAPYDDEVMKEIFQLSVEAFEKLSHVSGRCYTKAVSILDTVAKVRSCLVMLDLECDTLIIEMFQHFLKFIRSNHPHAVFSAMETIMTLVINESEDISWDLLSILLASVRKANQDVSSISWKLGEKVITNCAVKLKSNLMEAVQSRGIALDEYAEIVSDICKSGYETLEGLNSTGKYLATKRLDSVSPGEVCHDVDDISKSMKCNGAAPTGNDDSIHNRSSKVLEQCSHADHSRSTDGRGSAEPDDLDHFKPEIEQESAPKKRGRKPNSLMNPEEGYDHSWICAGRKTPQVPGHRKSHDKGYDCSLSVAPDSKKTSLLSTPRKVGEPASPTPKSRFHDESHSRRGRPKKKESMKDQDGDLNSLPGRSDKSAKSFLKKETENRCETEIKRRKRSLESGPAAMTNEETTPAPGCGVLEKEAEIPSDLKEKPQKLSVMKARGMGIDEDRSLVQEDIKEGNLVVAASAKGISDASGTKKRKISKTADKSSNGDGNNSEETPKAEVKRKHTAEKEVTLKKKIISKAASKSSNRERNYYEKTPKTEVKMKHTTGTEVKMKHTTGTEVKMKHTAGKEVASKTPGLGEQLVGRRIKVWWPMDKTFYEGVVDSYDRIKKKHTILYADGDEERLNLKKERWELIGDGSLSEGGQETNVIKPDASPVIMQKGKGETKFELVKEVKASSLKRASDYAIASKAKARKSGTTSADGAKLDKPSSGRDPMPDASERDRISKGDDQNSINKLIVRDRKLILTRSRPQQTTMSPSKGESPKGSRESPGVGRSGGEYLENMVKKNGKSSTDIEAKESVDVDK